MGRIEASRSLAAPAEAVWDVVVDPDVYERAAPNLDEVTVVTETGPGMVRRCVDMGGNEWTETCTDWEAGRSFSVAVDVETSDFHRRWFSRFEGTWTCEDRADDVLVTIAFDFETRYGPLGWLVAVGLEWKGASLVEEIFDGWEAEIGARLASVDGSEGETRGTRVSGG